MGLEAYMQAFAQADFHGVSERWGVKMHAFGNTVAGKWVEWQFWVTLECPHGQTRSKREGCADWMRKNVPNAMK